MIHNRKKRGYHINPLIITVIQNLAIALPARGDKRKHALKIAAETMDKINSILSD